MKWFLVMASGLVLLAGITFAAAEFVLMARIDGGGKQVLTLDFSNIRNVKQLHYVPIYSGIQRDVVDHAAVKYAMSDPVPLYSLLGAPSDLNVQPLVGVAEQIAVHQQWSYTESGLLRLRSHYTQSFGVLVVIVEAGESEREHFVIDLPEYGKPATVHLGEELLIMNY